MGQGVSVHPSYRRVKIRVVRTSTADGTQTKCLTRNFDWTATIFSSREYTDSHVRPTLIKIFSKSNSEAKIIIYKLFQRKFQFR